MHLSNEKLNSWLILGYIAILAYFINLVASPYCFYFIFNMVFHKFKFSWFYGMLGSHALTWSHFPKFIEASTASGAKLALFAIEFLNKLLLHNFITVSQSDIYLRIVICIMKFSGFMFYSNLSNYFNASWYLFNFLFSNIFVLVFKFCTIFSNPIADYFYSNSAYISINGYP